MSATFFRQRDIFLYDIVLLASATSGTRCKTADRHLGSDIVPRGCTADMLPVPVAGVDDGDAHREAGCETSADTQL